jgi:hypothetical protein
MAELQPYLISEFKTGIATYLKSWSRPQDAFFPLENACVYRGVINKRNGSTIFGNQLEDNQPVMGIILRIDESTSGIELCGISTRDFYTYNPGLNAFSAVNTIGSTTASFWEGTVYSGLSIAAPLMWRTLVPGSVTVTAYNLQGNPPVATQIGQMTDDGLMGWTAQSGIFMGAGAGGTIDYSPPNYYTNSFTYNFSAGLAPSPYQGVYITITAAQTTVGSSVSPGLGYFTGNNTNFFNYVNWQPSDPDTGVLSTSYLYITNDVDPVTLYDGTNLSRPVFYTTYVVTLGGSAPNQFPVYTYGRYVVTAQDVNVYKQSLLIFRPTIQLGASGSSVFPSNQAIYWSAVQNPFNFIINVPGNGGFIVAPTGDIFISEEILKDAIVCFFSNSTWLFRFTGITSSPFRIDRISVNKRNNVPYGTIAYDERATSLGTTGFLDCDGVNVQRYDPPIIDYYESLISEQYMSQMYSQRYDNLSQTWMNYVSNDTVYPIVGTGAPGSDSTLIYNHLENTWATYKWPFPVTCMGLYFKQTATTWSTLMQTWASTQVSWDSYFFQKGTPILLMGDVNGNIYQVDNAGNNSDNGNAINVDITGTRWNPIKQAGQKVQMPYLDFYYNKTSNDYDKATELTLNFYVDDSNLPAITLPLTLDGITSNLYSWKRIYPNIIGRFIQLEITGGADTAFQILGINLWVKPAGRFTP